LLLTIPIFRILGSLKKTIAIFCFTALLLSTSSLSLFFWVEEQVHEQERFASIAAGETIEEEHQITLQLKDKTILPDGYQWEEKGREFSHYGMFYDIVSLTKTEAGWELVAASDVEEAEIVAKQSISQHIDKELATNKKSTKQKFNFNISIFDQICASQCQQAILQLNQIAYSNFQVRLTETSLGQISPPPEAV
jgi:hypothetical protein